MEKKCSDAVKIISTYLLILSFLSLLPLGIGFIAHISSLFAGTIIGEGRHLIHMLFHHMKFFAFIGLFLGSIELRKLRGWRLVTVSCLIIFALDILIVLLIYPQLSYSTPISYVIGILKPVILLGAPVFYLFRPSVRKEFMLE